MLVLACGEEYPAAPNLESWDDGCEGEVQRNVTLHLLDLVPALQILACDSERTEIGGEPRVIQDDKLAAIEVFVVSGSTIVGVPRVIVDKFENLGCGA